MTPNELHVLMHYFVCPAVHPRIEAPAVKEAIEMWVGENMLASVGMVDGEYQPTPRGDAFIQYVLDTPLPKQHWVVCR